MSFDTCNLKVTDKFGYSLETFRLSALASLRSSKIEVKKDLDAENICVRIFGSDNQQAKSEFSNELNIIGNHFDQYPECECPLCAICDFKLTKINSQLESNNSENQSLQFADIFCGAGGLSTGLKSAGLKPVRAIDIDPASVITYTHNHISSKAVEVY